MYVAAQRSPEVGLEREHGAHASSSMRSSRPTEVKRTLEAHLPPKPGLATSHLVVRDPLEMTMILQSDVRGG